MADLNKQAIDKITPGALPIQFDTLPSDICISTMTITCKLNTIFNVLNIGKYIDINLDDIICVKHGHLEDTSSNRFIDKRRILQKNKKKTKSFYNQVTLIIKTFDNKTTNIKLFSNGSIQMTGCKHLNSIENVLSKLFHYLAKTKAIYDSDKKLFLDMPFVSNPEVLFLKNLYDFKICMINSNFNIDFNIDRDKLYEILLDQRFECTYDPIIHACVNIKYPHPDKVISVFVFESGSIIITGARNGEQIIDAYNFINRYLLTNYYYIIKDDIQVANILNQL
jgi:TATA-box binding protein (TBP) (component of TFIID and TFIIIB)